MWPVALLVFFASITVPVLKLIGLTFLPISVQRRSPWRPRDRTLLYRIIESVGRWSMVDIFMISILVALVNLGAIATIEPGARRDRLRRGGDHHDDRVDVVRSAADLGPAGDEPCSAIDPPRLS